MDCGVGDGVWASGDRGIFPADLRLGDLYCLWSFGASPCSELGRMCPELAGELGTLELGELLWEELPPTEERKRKPTKQDQKINTHLIIQRSY